MAVTNGYITLAEYLEYAKIDSTDANDDALIERFIEAASRRIDQITGLKFYTASVTLYYDYPQSRTLKFGKWLTAVSSITNGDGNAIASSQYNLLPYDGPPYYGVKLLDTATTLWLPTTAGSYEKCITVAGTESYAASVPENIKQACKEIVKSSYNRRMGKNMETTERVTSYGVIVSAVDIPNSAYQALQSYKQRL